ncbi:hypothetical protein GC425_07930 [Corynebacterium sp. zg254]|uniref:Restriction endonuclease subunit S n=1 Tax=Corynebacterium zhongnanshanii TaxID=2768834 RepID=A0ABQ6VC85_9CORY|nr:MULTISPECIES: restriction endonuclease subunit S [Corynebacterium]KAB1550741.1 restriction endonuclease subunit S [Corynebacterium sp. 321]KAB3519842.1 restriction endonuclease subunit S [Corynebacterium zhongnanshanii]MCR5914776.1 hypothetical protein [Corynebacterium sp. zg254]
MAEFPLVPFWSILSFINDSSEISTSGVRLEDIEPWSGKLIAGIDTPNSFTGTPYRECDVLFGKLRPYLAKSWLATSNGVAVGDIHVYRPKSCITEPRFLAYIVRTPQFISFADGSSEGAKMPRCEWNKLRQFPTPFPDLDTQRRIADYLDSETAQIDALMAELDEYVELLENRKTILVESIIKTTRFELVPMFSLGSIQSGEVISRHDITATGNIPVFGGNGLRGYCLSANQDVDKVLIGRQGALCGNIHLARAPFFASEHALVFTPKVDVCVEWMEHILRYMRLGSLSQAAAQPGINGGDVIRQRVPYVPLDKQKEIAQKITKEHALTDTIINECRELKDLLLKRRQVLISDVVTGKVEV